MAAEQCQPLAFVIAGHHGGLLNGSDLWARLEEWSAEAAIALEHVPGDLLATTANLNPPAFVRSAYDADLFLRMMFSALVDADYLDTERHFEGARASVRGSSSTLHELWDAFAVYHDGLPRSGGIVNELRADVYDACVAAASLPSGLFRLTVPTGGGKTLSSMAFALRHPLHHGMERVIVAVPYTSVTEQTAGVYRAAFGQDRAVLEHHSAIELSHIDEQTQEGLWGRLASENWDAPVIVTTTVQLFESLFAAATSKSRKVHRLARSVIILDEAQALPSHVLAPILDALHTLATQYGTSIVLCTATQPALDDGPGFRGLKDVREIAPNPPALFAALRRVEYELPDGKAWTWSQVADRMWEEQRALAILNTIADAQALRVALDDPDALHLSTLLCGAHRRDVLKEIHRRLKKAEPCRVVSTQVVEAGVDIDFPVVLRAMGPLDRIVQAAGRCNREGLLPFGRVIVFDPEEGKMPPGPYKTGAAQATVELKRSDADLHDPAIYERYFRALYAKVPLDQHNIQDLRAHQRFEDVGREFRLIEEDRRDVLVAYDDMARDLIVRLGGTRMPSRGFLRQLQPYLVGVRSKQLEQYRARGLIEEVVPSGVLIWHGEYDRQRGLLAENSVLFA